MEQNLEKLVNSKEKIYFGLVVFFSLIFYLWFIISIVGIPILIGFAIGAFFAQGLMNGHVKGNSVRLSKEQYGDVYETIAEFCQRLNIKEVPDVYLMQGNGIMNAFASRFLGRDFILLYSDVFELAYEKGENALKFILAHELTHIKRGHVKKMPLTVFGDFIPYLGTAYSRACEYTCDSIATYLTPENETEGLLVLMAGKKAYKNVNIEEYLKTSFKDCGFWSWFYEIIATHPNLSNRIRNVLNVANIKR